MKERDLIELGFKKRKVSAKESGSHSFYYYVWQPYRDSSLSLITDCNDEIKNDNWEVYSFNDERIKFRAKINLKSFINVIKKCIK